MAPNKAFLRYDSLCFKFEMTRKWPDYALTCGMIIFNDLCNLWVPHGSLPGRVASCGACKWNRFPPGTALKWPWNQFRFSHYDHDYCSQTTALWNHSYRLIIGFACVHDVHMHNISFRKTVFTTISPFPTLKCLEPCADWLPPSCTFEANLIGYEFPVRLLSN